MRMRLVRVFGLLTDMTDDLEVCGLHRHVHLRVLILTFALVKLRLGVVCVKLGEGEEGIRIDTDFLVAWGMF